MGKISQPKMTFENLRVSIMPADLLPANPDNAASGMSKHCRYEAFLHELALLAQKYRKRIQRKVSTPEELRRQRSKR